MFLRQNWNIHYGNVWDLSLKITRVIIFRYHNWIVEAFELRSACGLLRKKDLEVRDANWAKQDCVGGMKRLFQCNISKQRRRQSGKHRVKDMQLFCNQSMTQVQCSCRWLKVMRPYFLERKEAVLMRTTMHLDGTEALRAQLAEWWLFVDARISDVEESKNSRTKQ